MSAVQVRTGTVDDGAEIVDLLAGAVGDRGKRLDAAAHTYRHDPTAALLVAVLDGQIVGLVGYAIGDSEVTVRHIATAESARRHGIGTRLLAAVDETIGHRLPLVAETDEMSVAFYEAIGFRVESLGRKYPGVERFAVRRWEEERREDRRLAWPQFGLQINVDGARLQVPTESQLQMLARRAARPGAVLAPGEAHLVTWLGDRTPVEIEQERIAHVHSNLDLTRRPGWTLDLAVMVGGEPVGMQSVSGFDLWPRRRIVGTASWLLKRYQRQGIGTRCRAAVLELAFVHLAAETAKSWVLQDNQASIAVSASLGYHLVSQSQININGQELTDLVYQLNADEWINSSARRKYAPAISGATALAELLSR